MCWIIPFSSIVFKLPRNDSWGIKFVTRNTISAAYSLHTLLFIITLGLENEGKVDQSFLSAVAQQDGNWQSD